MKLKDMIPSKLELFKNNKKNKKKKKNNNKNNDESYCNQKEAERSKSETNSLFLALREKAFELTKSEPFMTPLLKKTILHPKTTNFNSAISRIIASRLMSSCGSNPFMCDDILTNIIEDAMNSTHLEYGHTMSDAVAKDILACKNRDPACETELEVVLFFKGFASLVCHRAARRHYSRCSNNSTASGGNDRRFVSLWLQSQASAAFGVDIHPAATIAYDTIYARIGYISRFLLPHYIWSTLAEIGAGVFFDHATGLVIGETAKVGDNCTILHGVTLGGTGKDAGDRHPKIGNDVLIGAGTSILGNIKIGNGAKIGAGSIVLNPIPHGATAVGAPAKVIGWAKENCPGSVVDMSLNNVVSIGEGYGNTSESNSTSSTEDLTDESNHSLSIVKKNNSMLDLTFGNDRNSIDLSSSVISSKIMREKERTSKLENNFCVFRRLSSNVPDALSYKKLRDVLIKNCSEDEIGEVYMELLKQDPSKVYVSKCEISKHFKAIATKFTRMGSQQLEKAQCLICKDSNKLLN